MKIILAALLVSSSLTAFAASEECTRSILKVMEKSVSFGVIDQVVRENPKHEQAAKGLEEMASEVSVAFQASMESCK